MSRLHLGPITLFDKSFLQSISLDEAVWFDRFFSPVVCPIFYVETLGDLGKAASKRGSAENTVAKDIAKKFPEMGGSLCAFHVTIATNDLLGNHVPLDGRIPRPGGRPVQKGVVYDPEPEELAFSRWQAGNFLDVEKIAAAVWRQSLAELDLTKVASELRSVGVDGKTCKSLDQARDMAKAVISNTSHIMAVLSLAITFLHVPQQLHHSIIQAWDREGRHPLSVFAPMLRMSSLLNYSFNLRWQRILFQAIDPPIEQISHIYSICRSAISLSHQTIFTSARLIFLCDRSKSSCGDTT